MYSNEEFQSLLRGQMPAQSFVKSDPRDKKTTVESDIASKQIYENWLSNFSREESAAAISSDELASSFESEEDEVSLTEPLLGQENAND